MSIEGTLPRLAPQQVLVPLGRVRAPAYRLICVPHAGGGSATFRPWPAGLPDWLEVVAVRLPGREALIDVPPLDRIDPVVELVAGALRSRYTDGVPFGLFGHSMGALICYALADRLRGDGGDVAQHLFVAGRRGAHIPDPPPVLHRLPREQFVERVLALDGIPEHVLQQPEILELTVPALQADFAVCEMYRHRAAPALPCSISAFGGDADPTTTVEQLRGWAPHTAGRFRMRIYPGNHFFLGPCRDDILRAVVADITADGHGPAPHGVVT